jgi:hypothetical protein
VCRVEKCSRADLKGICGGLRSGRASPAAQSAKISEGGRPSIPEAAVTEPTGRGVLDTRLRGYDGLGAGRESGYGARFPDMRFAHRSSMRRIAPNDGPIPPPLTLC